VASTNGVEIAVHELGGAGPPLVIAHASGFCGSMYAPLAAELLEHFRVVALDFRGHGDSTAPTDEDFAWGGMADDLFAVVAALEAGPVHAFGHSLGGATILRAELTRPGTIRSAFLFEPIVIPDEYAAGGPNVMAEAARVRRPSFASRAEALWRYASRPPLSQMRADALTAYVEHGFADEPDGSVRLKCRPEHEARVFESDTKLTVSDMCGLRLPAVIAVGHDEPGPNPAGFASALAAMLPDARRIEYPHVGHFGPLEDPISIGRDVLAHALATSH